MEEMENITGSPASTTVSEASVAIVSEQTLKIIYYIIGTLGLVGNSVVLFVLGTSRSLRRRRTNIFIINQSSIDFLAALFLILTTAIEADIPGNVEYCALWLTKLPLWSLLVSSTYSLLLITVERYLAITHAIWHNNNVGHKSVVVGITLVWLTGIAYNAAYMIPTSKIGINGSCSVFTFFPNITTQRAVGILTFVLQFLVPIVILIFCYLRMVHTLWIRLKIAPGINSQTQALHKKRGPLKNVVKTLVIVSACFILCWVCNQVYFLLFNLGFNVNFTNAFYHFTVVAVFFNCCINPVVYMTQYKQFQEGMKRLCKKNQVQSMVSTTQASALN